MSVGGVIIARQQRQSLQWSFILLVLLGYLCDRAWSEIEYNTVNTDGSFQFRHSNNDIGGYYHTASGSPDTIVRGRYGSRNPATGQIDETVYTAGPRGFRANGPKIHRKMDLAQYPIRPRGSPDDPLADPYDDPSYSFNFRTPDQSRSENSDSTGRVRGLYSYIDDVGERHSVRYAAGAGTGFEVLNAVPDNPVNVGYSAPLYKAHPKTRGKMTVQRGPDGTYQLILSGPDHRRAESRSPDGLVRGTYSYLDDKGVQRTVEYIAGAGIGYRIVKNRMGPGTHINPSVADFRLSDSDFQLTSEYGRGAGGRVSGGGGGGGGSGGVSGGGGGGGRGGLGGGSGGGGRGGVGGGGGGSRGDDLLTGSGSGTDYLQAADTDNSNHVDDFPAGSEGGRGGSVNSGGGLGGVSSGPGVSGSDSSGRSGGPALKSDRMGTPAYGGRGNVRYPGGSSSGGGGSRGGSGGESDREVGRFGDRGRPAPGTAINRGSGGGGGGGGLSVARPVDSGSGRVSPSRGTSTIPSDGDGGYDIGGGGGGGGGDSDNGYRYDRPSDDNYNFNDDDVGSLPPLITANRKILEIDRERDWVQRHHDSTVIKNVGKWYIGLPPGQSVRAHVQNIDLLPLGGRRVPSPSEALMQDEIADMAASLEAASSAYSN